MTRGVFFLPLLPALCLCAGAAFADALPRTSAPPPAAAERASGAASPAAPVAADPAGARAAPGGDAKNFAEKDPFEPFNRLVFAFNDFLDHYLLRGISRVYRDVVPPFVRVGADHFFDNLGEPVGMFNGILRADAKIVGVHFSRFVINSTVGVGGLFDVADNLSPALVSRRDRRTIDTVRQWGAPEGPYLVLPLQSPGTLVDIATRVPDHFIRVENHFDPRSRSAVNGAKLVHQRSEYLFVEDFIVGDRYEAVRRLYYTAEINRHSRPADQEIDRDTVFEDDF